MSAPSPAARAGPPSHVPETRKSLTHRAPPRVPRREGPFELLIDGGIRGFKAPRAQVVQISSAGVERNAIIGDDAERRKKDVPIVQLNPAGVLNHKYAAELAVRASGYPYTVVRGTGMVDKKPDDVPALLEADQGDQISGQLTRDDMADLLVHVLSNPEVRVDARGVQSRKFGVGGHRGLAVDLRDPHLDLLACALPQAANKTFEVRRSQGLDAVGKTMAPANYNRLFLKLALDRHRWRVGLRPFPKYSPPPAAPVSEQRVEVRASKGAAMWATGCGRSCSCVHQKGVVTRGWTLAHADTRRRLRRTLRRCGPSCRAPAARPLRPLHRRPPSRRWPRRRSSCRPAPASDRPRGVGGDDDETVDRQCWGRTLHLRTGDVTYHFVRESDNSWACWAAALRVRVRSGSCL